MAVVAPLPLNEAQRRRRLEDLEILDTLPEQAYDDLVHLASSITDCPISLVSLVATERQWFKARVGLDAPETSREVSFCAHAINDPDELFVVEDATTDPRFADNPLVLGDPSIRFYAGAPLTLSSGESVGTLCVIDRRPRELTDDEREALAALGRQAVAQLELRRTVIDREEQLQQAMEYERVLFNHRRELERSLIEAVSDATTDELTGVLNRRGLAKFGRELFEGRRMTGRPLSVVILDIDRFKQFNDMFGHEVGDEALRVVARAIETATRSSDMVVRYGGEEFVVLVPGELEAATQLAERIRLEVAGQEVAGRQLTASLGVAATNATHDHLADVIVCADEALYRAKDQGRDRVVVADVT